MTRDRAHAHAGSNPAWWNATPVLSRQVAVDTNAHALTPGLSMAFYLRPGLSGVFRFDMLACCGDFVRTTRESRSPHPDAVPDSPNQTI